MRTLKVLLTVLFAVGAQQRMFAPPYTYHFTLNPDGTTLVLPPFVAGTETPSGGDFSGTISGWSIPTPDGTLTPSDSTLSNPNFLLSPTMIPLDDLNFEFNGKSYDVQLSPSHDGGDVTYPGGSYLGTWSVPDNSNSMLLLFLTVSLTVGGNLLYRRSSQRLNR